MRGKFNITGSSRPWTRGSMRRASAVHRKQAACRGAIRKARRRHLVDQLIESGVFREEEAPEERTRSSSGPDTTVLLGAF